MSKPTAGMYWHVWHNQLVSWCVDVDARIKTIKTEKPEGQRATRLRLLRPVRGTLPAEYIEACHKCSETKAKCDKARRECDKAAAEYTQAEYHKAWAEYYKALVEYTQAGVKCYKARAALRPTLPRNWCKSAKPKLSASSIIIVLTLGISNPDSMIEVDMRTSIRPLKNSNMVDSISETDILP